MLVITLSGIFSTSIKYKPLFVKSELSDLGTNKQSNTLRHTHPTTNTAKTNRQRKQQTTTIDTLVDTLPENDNNNRIQA